MKVTKVTADTITDEQIREIEAVEIDAARRERRGANWEIIDLVTVALAPKPASRRADRDALLARRRDARARCAEILNERNARQGVKQ